ncbi:hypothetical protein H5410_038617 [Solanum commersonii]|uniref:Uncharacterized protein n=1 Tax=Solanum commersonii TaxID=4109 RepID=A0A9J5YAM3_SOLCO|nr:hypothetical protein H5410_038617 [Solanum commersonii]
MRKKTGEIKEKWVTINYDYVPKYCKTCKLQGHNEKDYYKRKNRSKITKKTRGKEVIKLMENVLMVKIRNKVTECRRIKKGTQISENKGREVTTKNKFGALEGEDDKQDTFTHQADEENKMGLEQIDSLENPIEKDTGSNGTQLEANKAMIDKERERGKINTLEL